MGNNLTIDQINAPDFSGIGQLMAGAGASFNNAFDAAHGVLNKYQDGQQAKADAGYLNALGNIKNEDELTSFFAKNPLAKANLSPDMMKTMLEMRNTVLGYESSRASTDSTRANTSINLAGEGRNAFDFQDRVAKMAADRAAQPAVTGAYVYGQTYGQGVGGGTSMPSSPQAGDLIAGLVARGVPEHVAAGVVMNAQDESGLNSAAIGDNGNAGGLLQWNGNRFKGLQAFAKDQGKDWQDPNVQLDWLMIENSGSEKAAWDKVVRSGTAQEAAVNFVNEWERPAEEHRARRAAAYAGAPGGATPGAGGFSGGQSNQWLNSPEFKAAIAAIQANKYLTASEAQGQIDQIITSAASGQDVISARDDKTQALLADQAIADAAQNSDLTTQGGIVSDVLGNTTLNPTTRVNAAGRADGLVGAGGSLNAVALPSVAPNQAAQAAADQATKNDAASTILSNVGRSADLAESMGSDPAKELMKSAGITEASGITSTVVERELDRYARESGLDKSEIAATLKVFDDQGIALEDVLKGKVDVSMVLDAAEKAYGATSKNKQTVELTTAAERASQRDSALAEIKSLQISLAKMKPGDPRQSAAQQRIQALTEGIAIGATPAEKIASQLQYVKPGSPEFLKIANELMAEVRKPGSGYSKTDIVNYSKQLGVP